MRTVRLGFRLAWVVVRSDLGKILILLAAVAWLASATNTERFRALGGTVQLALAACALLMLPINLRQARERNQDVGPIRTLTLVMASAVGLFGLDRFFPGYHLGTIGLAPMVAWFVATQWFPRSSRNADISEAR